MRWGLGFASQQREGPGPDFVVSLDFNGFLRMSTLLKSTGQSQLDQHGGPRGSDSLPPRAAVVNRRNFHSVSQLTFSLAFL